MEESEGLYLNSRGFLNLRWNNCNYVYASAKTRIVDFTRLSDGITYVDSFQWLESHWLFMK